MKTRTREKKKKEKEEKLVRRTIRCLCGSTQIALRLLHTHLPVNHTHAPWKDAGSVFSLLFFSDNNRHATTHVLSLFNSTQLILRMEINIRQQMKSYFSCFAFLCHIR